MKKERHGEKIEIERYRKSDRMRLRETAKKEERERD